MHVGYCSADGDEDAQEWDGVEESGVRKVDLVGTGRLVR